MLNPDEESILERNTVWFFSSARSGSTWIGTELLSYNTRLMSEPYISNHLGVVVGGVTDRVVRVLDRRSNNSDYFFSKKYQDVWEYFLRKLIINRIHAQFNDFSRKIILKEIIAVGASDIISRCMPNSKIIILVRDGRDVCDSYLDSRSGTDSWLVKNGATQILDRAERLMLIKQQVQNWTKMIEILMDTYDKHPRENRMMIKYEELRKNTTNELQKIYEFLQIDIPESTLNDIVTKFSFENIPNELKGKGKFRRFASPGKWRENFDNYEKQILKTMEPTLQRLGYSI